jgi:tetratricopeptide (TPR) repeat protein
MLCQVAAISLLCLFGPNERRILPTVEPVRLAQATPNAKKKIRKRVLTEEDIWGKEMKKEEETKVDEISPDEFDDNSSGEEKPEDVEAGWGKEAQQDSWGNEQKDTTEDDPDLDPKDEPEEQEPNKKVHKLRVNQDKAKENSSLVPEDTKDSSAHQAENAGLNEIKTESPAEPEPDTNTVFVVSGGLGQLDRLWDQRRTHILERNFSLATEDLNAFRKLRHELAIKNLYLHANVLMRQAEKAQRSRNEKRAEFLLSAAIEMAPDLPEAHLARAYFWFLQDPFSLARFFGGIADYVMTTWRNHGVRNRILVNLTMGLLFGLGLFAGLLCCVQMLRVIRLFLHDFHHLFPKGVSFFQTGILGVMILLLPVYFRLGLVVVLMTWLCVAWIYQTWRERSWTLLALSFLVSMPFGFGLVANGLSEPSDYASDLNAVVLGSPSEQSVIRLEARLVEHPADHVILAALGSYYKRMGELNVAKAHYSKAIQYKGNSAVLHNNLGNIHFLQNNIAAAIAYYQQATYLEPDFSAAYFNLSKAFYRRADLKNGAQSRHEANRLDKDLVSSLNDLAKSRLANYVVADAVIPEDWLRDPARAQDSEQQRMALALWQGLGGVNSLTEFWVCGIGAFVLLLLMLYLRPRVFTTNTCVRCGRSACRRCSPELRNDGLCSQCFHAFVEKSGVDARSRISKEIQIRQHRRRKESLARGISFVMPGVGQLLKGRTIRGGALLLLACLVLGQILFTDHVVRNTSALGSGYNLPWLAVLSVLFSGFYLWAIIDAFRLED